MQQISSIYLQSFLKAFKDFSSLSELLLTRSGIDKDTITSDEWYELNDVLAVFEEVARRIGTNTLVHSDTEP